ncbi:SMODS-associated NUDIX domain-containing protein [Streptomyces chartreusis]|uniref:SMODS-associated NUDIX domain-containing protein n=1 Tax=Streptomyces chartreusis TaxID=1969 RepID=UPI00365D5274
MSRVVAYFVASIALLALGFSFQNTTIGDIATGGFLALVTPVILAVNDEKVAIRMRWYSVRYRSEMVRISAAYLFRIKIDGKYLLVKGVRFPHYQPVGGVFKVSSKGRSFLAGVGAQDDDLIPIDQTSEADLRIRIRGVHLSRFYKWFDGRTGREDAPWREFQEELIATSILPEAVFPYILHEYHGRVVDRIRFSPYADSREVIMADVYELLPTREQEDALRLTLSAQCNEFGWFTSEEIRRRGVLPGTPNFVPIAEHAQKIV